MSQHTITNGEFLTVLFGADAGDAHVCEFDEDPSDAPRGSWFGTKWRRIRNGLPPPPRFFGNAYFAISLFDDDAEGTARRRKNLFRSCHVIVVDDVGTKVQDTSRLPPPAWQLETSPGNFQWGYRLRTPERDARRVNALLDGMVAAGIAVDGKDPGMKGVTRYVRLPDGVNTKAKYGPGGFQCRLTKWDPSAFITIEDLAQAWGIDLDAAPGVGVGTPGIIAVDPAKDEILALLDRKGMLLGGRTAAAAGVEPGYHCRCPWEDEHTGGAGAALDTGAAYFPGHGFKCHHGHCDGRGRAAIERWADREIEAESAGLRRLSTWEGLDVVPGYVSLGRHQASASPPSRVTSPSSPRVTPSIPTIPATSEARFFDEWVFVVSENEFFSLRTRGLVARQAVDAAWARELDGCLPVLNAKTGVKVVPSAWFLDRDNKPRARIADLLVYWPGEDAWFRDGVLTYVNTWVPGPRDWAAAAVGVDENEYGVRDWRGLCRHVCSRDGAWAVERLWDWMALVIAAPGLKPGWHVIVQGGQGLGKDLIAQPMDWAVGEGNIGRPNARALHSEFNPWAGKRLVRGSEFRMNSVGASNGHDQYNTLKGLTENTNEWVRINQKNMKEYSARNVSAWYVTSNETRAVAIEEDDRRFLVLMAGDLGKWGTADDYKRLGEWMKAGGAGVCAEWLRARWENEIAVDPARLAGLMGAAPVTEGKRAMIRATEDPVKAWVRGEIDDGTWPDLMTGMDVTRAVDAKFKSVDGRRLAVIMRELGCAHVNSGQQVRLKSGAQTRVWAVREPERFANMGGAQIAQAYISAAGHAFRDDESAGNNKVVKLASPDPDPGEAN